MIRDNSSPGETIKYRVLRNQGAKASRSLTASFSKEVSSVSSTSVSTGSSSRTSLYAQDKHFEGTITGGSTEREGQELVKTFHEKLESQEGAQGGVVTSVGGITGSHYGAQSQTSLSANGSASAQFQSSSQSEIQASSSAKTGSYSSMQTTFTSRTSTGAKSVSGQTTQVGVMREGFQEATTSSSSLPSGQESQQDMIKILQEENRQLKLKLASLGADAAQGGGASVSITAASGQISWDEEIKSLQTCSKEELLIKITHLLEERKTLKLQSEYVLISSQSSTEVTETDGKYVAAQGKVENGGAAQVNKEGVKGTSMSLQAELHDVTQLYNRILAEKNQLAEEVERFKASQTEMEEMKTKIKTLEEEKVMMATLKSENNSLKTENTKAEEEKVAKIEELKRLQQKLTTLKLENENLQAQNAKIEKEKASLIVKKQTTETTMTVKVEGTQETLKSGGENTAKSVAAKDTDFKKVQDELTSLKTEYKTLMIQKTKLEEEKGTLLAEAQDNSMLQGEIDDLKYQLNSLISENTILTAEKSKVQQEASTKAEEERKRLQRDLDTLKNNDQAVTVKNMQGKLDALTLKLERMQAEKTKLEKQVGSTEITKVHRESSLTRENETLKTKTAELQGGQGSVVAGAQKIVQGDKQRMTQEFTNFQMTHESANFQSTSQVVTMTNTQQGDMTSVHEELSSLKRENETLKTKIAELQGGQGSVVVGAQKIVQGDKQRTTQEFTSFQTTQESGTFQTTSQAVTVANIQQGDMTSLLLENESLKNDKAKLERERDSLLAKKEKLTTLEGEMTQMKTELSTLHTEKVEQAVYVDTDVKKVHAELKALKSENDVLKTQKTKLQEETGNLLAEVQKNTEELGKMEKVQSQVKSLVYENETLKTEKTKVMQEEAKKAEEERKRLQQELATLRNTDQEAIIARMVGELTSLKLEAESWKAEKDKMQRERTTFTTKMDGMIKMEEELSSEQAKVKTLEEEKVANKQVDIKKLQKQLKSLQAENQAMKTEKSKVEEEKRSLVVKTQEKMKMQVKTLEEQLTVLRSENETVKVERNKLKEKEAERMAEERKKLQEEMATLKITYHEQATKTIQGKLESLQLENESLKQEKAKLERERVSLSGKNAIERMQDEKTKLEQQVGSTEIVKVHEELSVKGESETLKTKTAELQVGQGRVVAGAQKNVTGDKQRMTQEFTAFQSTSQVVTVTNTQQGDMTSLLLENESLKNDKAKLERERDSLLAKEETLTTMVGEMTQMQEKLSTLHTEHESLKEEQAAYADTDVKKVRTELKALKSENDVLKMQKTKLQEETGNLLAEVQKNTDVLGKMKKVQIQVKSLVSENETLKTEKTKVMQEEAKKAEEERKRLQQELATLRNTDQEAIFARMEGELTSLKLEAESWKAEKDKMERERTSLTTKMDGMMKMEEELSSAQAKVKTLEEEKVANKQVDVKKLQKELASLQEEKSKLEEEKRSLVVETQEKMKMQVKTLEEQLTVLRSENETVKVERNKLKEKEDERMAEERKKLQEEMATLKITYQEQATKTMQGKLESLQLENESLKQEKAKLERERVSLSWREEKAVEEGDASTSFVVKTKMTTSRTEVHKTKGSASFRSEAKGLNEIEVIKEEMEGERATVSQLQGRSAVTQEDVTKLQEEIASLRAENQTLKAELLKLKERTQTLTLTEMREVERKEQTTDISESSSQVTTQNQRGEMVDLSKTQEATDSTLERIREEMSTLQTLLEEKDELHDADDAEKKEDTTDSVLTNKDSESASLKKEIEILKTQVETLRNEKEKYETLVMGKWQVIDIQGDSALQLLQEENRKLRAYIEENDMKIATAAMQASASQAVQVEVHTVETSTSTTKQGSQSTEEENKVLKKQIEELQQALATKSEESSANVTKMQLKQMEVTQLQTSAAGAMQVEVHTEKTSTSTSTTKQGSQSTEEENKMLKKQIEELQQALATKSEESSANVSKMQLKEMEVTQLQTSAAGAKQVEIHTEKTSTSSSSSSKQGSQSTEEENKMLKKQIEELQLVQGNLQQALATKLEESSANVTRMQLMEMEVTQLYQLLQEHGVSKEQVKQITTSVEHTEDVTKTASLQAQSVVVTQQSEEVQCQTTKTTVKSSKLSRLEEEAAKMAQKRKKLQQELASLKTSYQEEGAAKSQEVTVSQKSETVLTQTTHGQVTSLSMELEQEMSSMKMKLQDYEQIQTELAETKKELAKFTADKNGKGKSKKAAKETQATQEKIDMLQMQVKELTLQVRILSTSKADLDDTRKKLAELQKENTSLSGQLGKMKAMEREVTIARSVIQQLKDDNEKMALKMKKSKK